jgi:hypothetical protein
MRKILSEVIQVLRFMIRAWDAGSRGDPVEVLAQRLLMPEGGTELEVGDIHHVLPLLAHVKVAPLALHFEREVAEARCGGELVHCIQSGNGHTETIGILRTWLGSWS